VPMIMPNGTRLHVLAYHASTPAFDGPEARNDLRNRDELRFWIDYLDDVHTPFVLIGDSNLDPFDGDGLRRTMQTILADPRIQDPKPRSRGAAEAAIVQGGVNADQHGDPSLDTVDWPDESGWPGNLRVDYVLPSAELRILGSGVFWPAFKDPLRAIFGVNDDRASRHALVWVDIEW